MRKNTDKCKPFILLNKGLQGQSVYISYQHNRTNTTDKLQSKGSSSIKEHKGRMPGQLEEGLYCGARLLGK